MKNGFIIGLLCFVVVGGLISLNCFMFEANQRSLDNALTRITDKAISESPDLQKLDTICTSVPLPEGFEFASKGGLDDQKVSLAYRYSSDRSWDEARKVFYEHFSRLKWGSDDLSDRSPPQIDFSDGNYRVAISMQRDGQTNKYTIYCEKQ